MCSTCLPVRLPACQPARPRACVRARLRAYLLACLLVPLPAICFATRCQSIAVFSECRTGGRLHARSSASLPACRVDPTAQRVELHDASPCVCVRPLSSIHVLSFCYLFNKYHQSTFVILLCVQQILPDMFMFNKNCSTHNKMM